MKGTILDFSIQTNLGLISAEDHQRYEFNGAQWRGQHPPQRGDQVDFQINHAGQAEQIYATSAATARPFEQISQQLDKISNQNQDEENYNPIDWFVKCLKNYVGFEGRARRKEFWFFTLVQFGLLIIAQIIDKMLGTGIFYAIVTLALFLPSLAVAARRLHDIGKSGWWLLLGLIPVIGIIILIIWFIMDTKSDSNRWGRPAK